MASTERLSGNRNRSDRSVQFEIPERTMTHALEPSDHLFTGQLYGYADLSTRQYHRLVLRWVGLSGSKLQR